MIMDFFSAVILRISVATIRGDIHKHQKDISTLKYNFKLGPKTEEEKGKGERGEKNLRNIIRHSLREKGFEEIRVHVPVLHSGFAWGKSGHVFDDIFYSLERKLNTHNH